MRSRPWFHILVGFLSTGALGCGDALLPAQYSGPPEAEVSGVVFLDDGMHQPARVPKLSLQWLTTQTRQAGLSALTEQQISFERSAAVEQDWDIDLSRPTQTARTEVPPEHDNVQMLVGKIVYFDDANDDSMLSWRCRDAQCDRAVSVGEEYIVYVIEPVVCQSANTGGPARRVVRLTPGFHYFRYSGNIPEKIEPKDGVRFLVENQGAPSESQLVGDLQTFTDRLLFNFSLDALGDCGGLSNTLPL